MNLDIRRRYVYPALRFLGRITGRHVSGAYCWCIHGAGIPVEEGERP